MSETATRSKISASRPVRLGEARPLGAVDDQAVDGVDELLERSLDEWGQPAPAQEDRQVGQEQRLDHARRRLRAVPAEPQPDRLGADLAQATGREAVDLDAGVEPVLGVRPRDENDRPRGVPLGQPRQHVLSGLDPRLGNPRDVRRHARPLVRLPGLRIDAQPSQLMVDLGDRS